MQAKFVFESTIFKPKTYNEIDLKEWEEIDSELMRLLRLLIKAGHNIKDLHMGVNAWGENLGLNIEFEVDSKILRKIKKFEIERRKDNSLVIRTDKPDSMFMTMRKPIKTFQDIKVFIEKSIELDAIQQPDDMLTMGQHYSE